MDICISSPQIADMVCDPISNGEDMPQPTRVVKLLIEEVIVEGFRLHISI